MAFVFINGMSMQTRFNNRPALPELPAPTVPLLRTVELPLPPMAGAEMQFANNVILDGITADIGETVAIVIQGDGPFGVFVGRVADINTDIVRLVLTVPVGPIPAGTIIAIRRSAIAAAARIQVAS